MLQPTMNPGDDSDWADLVEELGLESKPAPKPRYAAEPAGFEGEQTPGEPPPFPAVPWPQDPTAEAANDSSAFAGELSDLPDAVESFDDTRIDPSLSAEEMASEDTESAEGEEGPGTGKKRRRRRRRRKGGPAGEQTGDAADAGSEFETDAENEVEPTPVEPRTTADAIRELVRNWSVPSWQEVVSGLYRPGGNDR
jgi:hypothetical protein